MRSAKAGGIVHDVSVPGLSAGYPDPAGRSHELHGRRVVLSGKDPSAQGDVFRYDVFYELSVPVRGQNTVVSSLQKTVQP